MLKPALYIVLLATGYQLQARAVERTL